MKNILIFGSTGAIGGALVAEYATNFPDANIHAISRSGKKAHFDNVTAYQLNFDNEVSMQALAKQLKTHGDFDRIVVAIGTLHDGDRQPEKSLAQLSFDNLQQVFTVNTFIPAMLAKHFTPLLNKKETSVFAVLSARVGSISDNRLGGWHAYRSSKTALNMLVKNVSIEMSRRNKNAVLVALHPGTVDSNLSEPFQARVPDGKLFTPEFCAQSLVNVMNGVSPEDSGKCFAWDGSEVLP